MRTTALLTLLLAPLALGAPAGPAPGAGGEALADAERLQRGAAALTRMRRAVREALGDAEEARRTKDLVRLTCMDEKLPALRQLLQSAEGAEGALRAAVGASAAVDVAHAYAKVVLAAQTMDGLRADLERCLGQLAFRTEDGVTVEVQPPPRGP